MTSEIVVNTDLGNGLLPDGSKLLSKPMLTNHQLGLVAVIGVKFHRKNI